MRALKKASFEEDHWSGSHCVLRRASDRLRAVVPCHAGEVLPPGTLKGILEDAGMSVDDLVALL